MKNIKFKINYKKLSLIVKSIFICSFAGVYSGYNLSYAKDSGLYVDIAAETTIKYGSVTFEGTSYETTEYGFGEGISASIGYGYNVGETVIGINLNVGYDATILDMPVIQPLSLKTINTFTSTRYKPGISVTPGFFLGKTIGESFVYALVGLESKKQKFDLFIDSNGGDTRFNPDSISSLANAKSPQKFGITPTFSLGYTFGISPFTKLFIEGTYGFTNANILESNDVSALNINYKENYGKFTAGITFALQ